MSISFILVLFLYQMAVGMMATIAVLPTDTVDRNFFRSISFWSLLFVALSLVFRHYSTFGPLSVFEGHGDTVGSLDPRYGLTLAYVFGALCLHFWGRAKFTERPVSSVHLRVIAAIGVISLLLEAWPFLPGRGPFWMQALLVSLNFLSAGFLLGGFLTGMIFGHHYLVNTDMPKKLLVSMAWILIAVLAFRILAVGATLLLYKEIVYPGTDFLTSLVSFNGHGIFFWQRILVGLMVPSVVVAMIYSTAKIGSNQSATGIMYVAIAFVFIGELAARYLFLLSGIPL